MIASNERMPATVWPRIRYSGACSRTRSVRPRNVGVRAEETSPGWWSSRKSESVFENYGRMSVEIGSSSGKAEEESDTVVVSATTTTQQGGDPARRAPDGSSQTCSDLIVAGGSNARWRSVSHLPARCRCFLRRGGGRRGRAPASAGRPTRRSDCRPPGVGADSAA